MYIGRRVLAAAAQSTIRSFFKPIPAEDTMNIGSKSTGTMEDSRHAAESVADDHEIIAGA